MRRFIQRIALVCPLAFTPLQVAQACGHVERNDPSAHPCNTAADAEDAHSEKPDRPLTNNFESMADEANSDDNWLHSDEAEKLHIDLPDDAP